MKGYDAVIRVGLATFTVFYFGVSIADVFSKAAEDYPSAEVMAVTSHYMIEA